jgi:two-component system cell cycle sensor histidine kinase/response regulator CckA
VYSEPGIGTTFKIYLPRVEAPADPWEEHEPITDAATGTGSILVVEDEPLLCELVGQTLKRHGYKVTTAGDGGAATHLARANPPDLVITDVVMPGMSGVEVVSLLRERIPGLRAVFMSGYTENAIVHRGELDSDVVLLAKPFTSRELLSVIRSTLDSD